MTSTQPPPVFDAAAKERALRAESESWDTRLVQPAQADDIPIVDVRDYLSNPTPTTLALASAALGSACRGIGFYFLVGHGLEEVLEAAFAAARGFFAQGSAIKAPLSLDESDNPVPGSGYLPIRHQMLPRRAAGNENEALIFKQTTDATLADNRWPELAGFRAPIETLACRLETLALQLLPLYAKALELPAEFFSQAFLNPTYRLRMTHYPPHRLANEQQFGIAPHVDTTFFTLLATQQAGLAVQHQGRNEWIAVPDHADALVVNTGEILKQWSNDEFVSTRHFANNTGAQSRYSIPFFFNPTPDYVMTCLPSCQGPDRPSKYPPFSYATSQGSVQGE